MSVNKVNHEPPRFDAPLPLDRLGCLTLAHGSHGLREDGVCLLEAVAWVAGEPHSDHPACVSVVLGAFGRAFNDGLLTDDDRTRLLKPLVPRLVNTRGDDALEERRAIMAIDWLVRVHTPAWLDLRETTKAHGAALRAMPEIRDVAALVAAQPYLDAARAAAAQDEAAARDAAWAAARDAAWAAARDAAWDAAWAAANKVAYGAALAVLAPVIEGLQASAIDLFNRMIDAGRVPSERMKARDRQRWRQ